MGMSMHVAAVKPADEEYQRKAAAYDACVAAKITPPRELEEFFNGKGPDPTGTTITLGFGPAGKIRHESAEPYAPNDGEVEGFQIDITKLPPGTRHVRFWCEW